MISIKRKLAISMGMGICLFFIFSVVTFIFSVIFPSISEGATYEGERARYFFENWILFSIKVIVFSGFVLFLNSVIHKIRRSACRRHVLIISTTVLSSLMMWFLLLADPRLADDPFIVKFCISISLGTIISYPINAFGVCFDITSDVAEYYKNKKAG